MDGWIATRIRATSRRRVITWTLALILGVLIATSDHRYIANFLSGPYTLERADLDSIRDVTLTPRYYARVKGERVIDTGIRQYTVHTMNGVETSREESGAYNALAIGNHYLVVRTSADDASPAAEGKLVPWSDDLEHQLFDTKAMREIRSSFYPFYLDSDSFRRPGYVVILAGIVFLALFYWQAVPAWRAWRNPERHPLAQRIARWGNPMAVALEAEHEFGNPLMKGKAGWRFGNKYLVRSTFFTFNVLRMGDVLWGYKKITKHSVNFIPTGKTYEAIVAYPGGMVHIPGSEKKVHEMLAFVQQRAPWAMYGYSDELAATFHKRPLDFARSVEQRRQQWAAQQQSGSAIA
ncbi:MAG TPA: DUF6709 family protein [Gemmatimonadales bacterium]|nr:DUF6709 family protein [Gemmatimonadales bacterium]